MPPTNNASISVSPTDNAVNRIDLGVNVRGFAAEPACPDYALHDRFITLHLDLANPEYSSYSGESNEDDDDYDDKEDDEYYDDDTSDDNYFQDDDMPMVLDYDPLYDDLPPLGPL